MPVGVPVDGPESPEPDEAVGAPSGLLVGAELPSPFWAVIVGASVDDESSIIEEVNELRKEEVEEDDARVVLA